MNGKSCRQLGVTLPELLLALALAGALAVLAVPGFAHARQSARLTAGANQLVGALHHARSAAILRSLPTVLCLSDDGRTCRERSGGPARGWLLFHDRAASSPVRLDAADELLRRFELPEGVTLHGTRAAVTFWPAARAGTTGTFRLCAPAGARAVIVSRTGRPRSEQLSGAPECAT